MKKFCYLLVAITLISPAFATSWIEIGPKEYIMPDKVEGNVIGNWIKLLNDGTFKKYKNQDPWYYLIYVSNDCENRKIKYGATYIYDKSGQLLDGGEYHESWKMPVPQSREDNWQKISCEALQDIRQNP